jgi:hypothetical protein
VDDCEVEKAGKKACKNCTCGRAELEEKTPLTAAQLNNPQSACGNVSFLIFSVLVHESFGERYSLKPT